MIKASMKLMMHHIERTIEPFLAFFYLLMMWGVHFLKSIHEHYHGAERGGF